MMHTLHTVVLCALLGFLICFAQHVLMLPNICFHCAYTTKYYFPVVNIYLIY